MPWAQIRPLLGSLPGGGEPPVFQITASDNGTAVVELGWGPAALLAPASYPAPDQLTYYSTNVQFSASLIMDNGSTRAIDIPAQTIQVTGGQATWVMPKPLWDAYVEETFKALRTPPTTAFRRSIYYRVRFTPTGSSTAVIWPEDATLQNLPSSPRYHPRLSILPLSGAPSSQVVPDGAAVQAMGGITSLFPTLWGDLLISMWKMLPEADPNRRALAQIFAHPNFQSIPDANLRGKILKLWLFAGSARPKLPRLLDRQAVIGSNVTTPVVLKRDLRGGNTLVDNLLSLLQITTHPEIAIVNKEQLLDDVITEILDPNGQVNQGEAGTCTLTSLQTFLITVNPSEYVRLQLGLLSSSGSAQLANGSTVSLPPAIFQLKRYTLAAGSAFFARTYSELAFQAALLKFGQGSHFPTYNSSAPPDAPNGINTVFQATVRGGLTEDQADRALEAIFNTTFTLASVHLSSESGWPTYATIQSRQPGIRDGLIRDLPATQQPVLLSMYWNKLPPALSPGESQPAHTVLALRHENGRVYFKNPQYAGSNPAGTAGSSAPNPPRRYEDPAGAIESMTEADLATWILWYHTPTTAVI